MMKLSLLPLKFLCFCLLFKSTELCMSTATNEVATQKKYTSRTTPSNWGYEESNGPEHFWGGICKCGKKQSPIDIPSAGTESAKFGNVKFVNYNIPCTLQIVNNGHSVQVSGFGTSGCPQPYIQDGGLGSKYDLAQFHFHWGLSNKVGSEHTLDGHAYPLELHLVHIKRGLTLSQAITKSNGIAVVGVWYAIGTNSAALAPLQAAIQAVEPQAGLKSTISNFAVQHLLPRNRNEFYRYNGSLTTPDCNQAVVWTVYKNTKSVTKSEMNLIRSVHLASGGPEANFRPTQPLNGRPVYYHV